MSHVLTLDQSFTGCRLLLSQRQMQARDVRTAPRFPISKTPDSLDLVRQDVQGCRFWGDGPGNLCRGASDLGKELELRQSSLCGILRGRPDSTVNSVDSVQALPSPSRCPREAWRPQFYGLFKGRLLLPLRATSCQVPPDAGQSRSNC